MTDQKVAQPEPVAWLCTRGFGYWVTMDKPKLRDEVRATPLYAAPPMNEQRAQPVAPLHGFDRDDLAALADGLDWYEKRIGVGNVTGEGEEFVESATAAAARFIRATLAAPLPATPAEPPIAENINAMVYERVHAWAATPEGAAAIERAIKDGQAAGDALSESRRVDPAVMNIPMGATLPAVELPQHADPFGKGIKGNQAGDTGSVSPSSSGTAAQTPNRMTD